ncbi:MAG: hypothetical protein LBU32_19570 [Clostridiales bacterium]|jgi:multimeric flavodoxin WrbA|nr:hypothetical protein [Clostridiales bacterium]
MPSFQALGAARQAGGIHTLDSMNHFFLLNDMVTPGSAYWNMSLSLGLNDFESDEEGVRTVKRLDKNIALRLKAPLQGR